MPVLFIPAFSPLPSFPWLFYSLSNFLHSCSLLSSSLVTMSCICSPCFLSSLLISYPCLTWPCSLPTLVSFNPLWSFFLFVLLLLSFRLSLPYSAITSLPSLFILCFLLSFPFLAMVQKQKKKWKSNYYNWCTCTRACLHLHTKNVYSVCTQTNFYLDSFIYSFSCQKQHHFFLHMLLDSTAWA